MACVARAWKGRERGCFGAAPSRFFRAQNPLSLPFQTPVTPDFGVFWRLSVHGRRPINRLYSLWKRPILHLCLRHCTCSRYWSRRNHLNCRSVIELNRTQSKDWVRLSSVIEHSRTQKIRESLISALNWSNRTSLNVLIYTQNRQEQSNKTTRLSTIMKNKCSGFIEFAWSLCFTVALLSFPGPRGRYKSGGGLNLKGTL